EVPEQDVAADPKAPDARRPSPPQSVYQPLASFHPVPSSPYATWALVVGILGIICFVAGPLLGLIAIVLGILWWRQVSTAGGAIRGRFSAGAGIAAGVLAIVFFMGEAGLYLWMTRPSRVAAAGTSSGEPSDPPAAASADKNDPSGAPAVTPAE